MRSEDVEKVNSQANLGLVQARAGNRNLAMVDLFVAEVAAGGITTMPVHTAINLAELCAALGDLDRALEALGTYGTPRDMHFQLHLRCSPTFAPLAQDSAFRALLVIPRPAAGAHC